MGEGRISNIIETTETDLGMPAKKKNYVDIETVPIPSEPLPLRQLVNI